MKSLYFTEDHEIFRESVRKFIANEVTPKIDEWEKDHRFSKDILKKMGDLGFLGINYPESVGGSGLDFFYTVVFCEELAKCGAAGFPMSVAVIAYMATPPIFHLGTQELKEKYLIPAIKGEKVGSLAITEPNCGSDVAAITTFARKEGDHYVINGSKTFITNAYYGDFYTMAVKTDKTAGINGISMIVVDANTKGITKRLLNKLGCHSSDTAELSFEDVRVPVTNLLGEEGQGFYYIMNNFQVERLLGALLSTAGAELMVSEAMQYANTRQAFNKPISKFQINRHKIADMVMKVELSKNYNHYCSWMYQNGETCIKEISLAKIYATEIAKELSDTCLQLHGGYGYMEEYKISRGYRDARMATIGGGTTEIMREIVAKLVIDEEKMKMSQMKEFKKSDSVASAAAGEKEVIDTTTVKGLIALYPKRVKPEKTAGKKVSVLYQISGDQGGEWTVSINDGKCTVTQGNAGNIDATIKMKDETYVNMENGKVNPQMAFMTGKLKVDKINIAMDFITSFTRLQKFLEGGN